MIAKYLADAKTRGLTFSIDGETLLVAPKAALTPFDRAYIKANKPSILAFLASGKADEASEPTCCSICPGAENELCCGIASEVEYLMPDGLISAGWCLNLLDVTSATHYRNRWERGEWTPIKSEKVTT